MGIGHEVDNGYGTVRCHDDGLSGELAMQI